MNQVSELAGSSNPTWGIASGVVTMGRFRRIRDLRLGSGVFLTLRCFLSWPIAAFGKTEERPCRRTPRTSQKLARNDAFGRYSNR